MSCTRHTVAAGIHAALKNMAESNPLCMMGWDVNPPSPEDGTIVIRLDGHEYTVSVRKDTDE